MLYKIISVNSKQLSRANFEQAKMFRIDYYQLGLTIISWDRVLSSESSLLILGSTLAQSGSRWDGYKCVGLRKSNRGRLGNKVIAFTI